MEKDGDGLLEKLTSEGSRVIEFIESMDKTDRLDPESSLPFSLRYKQFVKAQEEQARLRRVQQIKTLLEELNFDALSQKAK